MTSRIIQFVLLMNFHQPERSSFLSYPILYIHEQIDIKIKILWQLMSTWRSFHGHIYIRRRHYIACS